MNDKQFEELTSIFGYYTGRSQIVPTHDPGLEVNCPFCGKKLAAPMQIISFLVPGDSRSYFYRFHKACYDEDKACDIESILVDKIYQRMLN